MYQHSPEEVETALRAVLTAIGPADPERRFNKAAAAYATHPELGTYFEQEVAALDEIPDAALRTKLLKDAARLRLNVQRKLAAEAARTQPTQP